jgi:hypothetical protein
MSYRAFLPIVCLVSVAACGGTVDQTTTTTAGAGGAGTASTTGTSTGGSGGTFTGQTFSVEFGPISVDAGQEDTQCVVVALNNPAAIHVGTIHNQLGVGSHHLIVYKTNETMEQKTPFKCQPFADLLKPDQGTPLMISQKKDDTLTLPKGVAFGIPAQTFIRLEMHYINPSPSAIMVSATSTFVTMNDAEFQNEADFLFFGNPDIKIPAHSAFTLGPTYIPLPTMLEGSNFFGFTGHEHQWGTKVTVASTTGKTGPDTSIYDVPGWSWSEPATVYKDPPVVIPQGGGFHLTCDWQNESASTVKFGESANAEMCFFWTYYYPSKGAFVCAHTDQVPGGYDLCCPGSPLCSMIFP